MSTVLRTSPETLAKLQIDTLQIMVEDYEKAIDRLTKDSNKLAQMLVDKEAEVERLTEDAERWRAIIGCARVRVLGSAGVVEPKPEGYAHIGVELWTHYPAGSEPMAVEHMTKFADLARKAVRHE